MATHEEKSANAPCGVRNAALCKRDAVDAFGRCICQWQESQWEWDESDNRASAKVQAFATFYATQYHSKFPDELYDP